MCIVSPRICVWMIWTWIQFPQGVNCATSLTLSPRRSALKRRTWWNLWEPRGSSAHHFLFSQIYNILQKWQIRTEQTQSLKTSIKQSVGRTLRNKCRIFFKELFFLRWVWLHPELLTEFDCIHVWVKCVSWMWHCDAKPFTNYGDQTGGVQGSSCVYTGCKQRWLSWCILNTGSLSHI